MREDAKGKTFEQVQQQLPQHQPVANGMQDTVMDDAAPPKQGGCCFLLRPAELPAP